MPLNPRTLVPSSSFTPKSISGLALWLDASDAQSLYTTDAGAVTAVSSPMDIATPALWLDASDAASITESGGLVSQWNDKSGNNRHATASSTARPTTGTRTVGGRNALDFDGTANSMATGGSAFPTAATHTVFLVYQLDSASQSRTSVLLTAATIGHQEIRVAGFGSTAVQYVFNNNLGTTMASTAIGLGPIVFSAREATASMRSAGAGVVSTISGSAFAWSSGSMLIGSRTAGNYVDGLLCEVIIYPTTLTDSQTSSVEAYLAAKWGISGVHAPATASNDPVGAWLDKSGNGRHATQATAASRPVLGTLNGKRALAFDGTNDNLFVEDYSVENSLSGLTRFVVFDQDLAASAIFVTTNTSAKTANAGGATWWQRFGSNWYGYSADGVRYHGGTADESPHVATNFFDGTLAASFGTRLQNYIDGALLPVVGSQGTLGTTTGASGAKLSIGSNLGLNNFLNGKILEVLSYTRALSSADRLRVNRYLAAKWGIVLAPQVSNADAQDWINRVYANGGTVSASTAAAVNTLCDSLDAASLRDRFYRLNLFCGTGLNAALVPLYRGPSLGGTQYGNTTDTNVGPFVSGDYAETGASGGLVGNGTSKYLNTGLNANSIGTEGHAAIYHRTSIANAGAAMLRVSDGASHIFGFDYSTGVSNMRGFWGSTGTVAFGSTSGGLHTITRRSATDLEYYRNGGSVGTQATSVTPAAPAQPFYVFASNQNGTPGIYSAANLQAYSLGLSMTASQVSAYNTAIQAFQTALSRA